MRICTYPYRMVRKANNRRTSGASEKKNIRMGKTDGGNKNYYTI